MRARLLIAAAAGLGVGLVYADSVTLGLWWDDYHVLRPANLAEIVHTFYGTWDETGIFPPFYRPITAAYHAAVFHVLGFNAPALHALSMILLAVIAWLVGVFVSRESASHRIGAIAALLYGVHPAISRSEGPWFFMQYHSLASIVTITALLVWQRRRARADALTWWPIVVLATVGVGIRESLLILLPAIVVLQAVRARLSRDVPPPSRGLWLIMAVHVVMLIALRQWALGELGGTAIPQGIEWFLNTIRGPGRTLLIFQPGSWPANQVASVMSLLVLAAGGFAAVRTPRSGARELLLIGVVLMMMFNLPLILASSSTRFYLLGLAAVIMLSGAIVGYPRYGRYVGGGVILVLVGSFTLASRAAIAPQHPCGPENLQADADVRTWEPVPVELRAWLARKADACVDGIAPDLAESIHSVVWRGNHREVVVGVNAHADHAALHLRLTAGQSAPAVVRIQINGGAQRTEWLTSDRRSIEVALPPTWLSRLRRLHRIDVWLDPSSSGTIDIEAR
jgi:hypothetical protein